MVTCDVTVQSGVTLTVQPGVVVKFQSSVGMSVYGVLDVRGTAVDPVHFTSKDDTYGGDTNGDGGASLPYPGDWRGIDVYGNGYLVFNHTILRYGGGGGQGMIRGDVGPAANESVSITVNNSVVEHSASYGLYLRDGDANQRSTLSVSHSTFRSNCTTGESGLYAYGSIGDVTITSSTFADNGDEWGYGAYVHSDTTVVATGNTFSRNGTGFFMETANATVTNNVFADNSSAPGYLSVNGTFTFSGNTASGAPRLLSLSGNVESDLVLDTGVPYYGIGTLSIAAGHSLTVQPGVIVKLQYGGLGIHGTLNVQGTAANPVVFTSWKDDSYGGDTNGDGNASLPSPGDWYGIEVHANGQLTFDHAILRYGGGGGGAMRGYVGSAANEAVSIVVNDSVVEHSSGYGLVLSDNDANQRSTLSVSNSTFRSNGSGLYAYGSIGDVTITGSTFADNGEGCHGARVGSDTSVVATGNTFSGNGTGFSMEAADATVTNNVFADNSSAQGDLRVNGIFAFSGNTASGAPRLLSLSGNVESDLVLDTGVPYYGIGTLSIAAGHSLTVQPGVIVKLQYGGLGIHGTLNVQGTAANPVVFTSWKDDSYGGDTNGDGNASLPSPGDWYGIEVHANGQLTFDHAILRYGGGGGGAMRGYVGSAANEAVSIVVNDSVVEHSSGYGLVLSDNDANQRSTLSVSNSTFRSNGSGLYAYGSIGDVTITGSTFADNGESYGARVDSDTTVVATGNTFSGNGTGFFMEAANATVTNNVFADNSSAQGDLRVNGIFAFSGNTASGAPRLLSLSGNVESDLVLDTGVPYYGIISTLSIAAGHSLTVQPGVIVKLQYGGLGIQIHGTLNVQGTAANPVVFTSWKDDSYGGDTNGDGNASLPSPGDWYGIEVYGNGQLAFDHAILRYGGGGGGAMIGGYVGSAANEAVSIVVNDSVVEHSSGYGLSLSDNDANQRSTLSVGNSTFRNNSSGGLYAGGSIGDVTITGSTFADNGGMGAGVSSETGVIATNNFFVGNATYGLYNGSYEPIDARYSYWGSNDGPAPYGSGDAINTWEEWDPVCECYVTVPAVIFTPWRNDSGEVVGPPPAQTSGVPSNPTTGWEAEPVNVVFGNYIYQYTDLAFPTRGEDFAFRRTYNSASTDDSPLGPGWTHNYHIIAVQTSANTVVVQREDGRKDLYTDAGGGNYLSPPGIYDTLTRDTDHFVLARKDQVVYAFNPDGTLATIAAPNGNTTSLTYSSGKLTTVTEPAGRQVTLAYSGDLLIQISDPAGRTISFGYTSGRLTGVTDVRGQTTAYVYDGAGRLQSITDANGHTFVNNVYDSRSRVIEQRDALDNLTTFGYDPDACRTTVTSPRKYTTVYQYDSAYRITAVTDALGNSEFYTYDARNNRTQVTDKRGNVTRFAYDDQGNVLVITDALGFTRTFTYDNRNNLLSETDPLGHTTTYEYDTHSNLIRRTDALGNVTTWAYDTYGQMLSTTDARGNTTQYGYDAYGHQTVITDALGNATTFTYDIVGRKLSETDPLGRTTAYTYDAANRLLTISEPLDKVTIYTYDPVGNRISITDPRGGVTTFTYDEKDRLVSVSDPLGHTTSYGYDAVDNQTVITDALGHATIYTYDALNRRTSVTDPLGNTTSYSYDANGNRTSLTDANGNVTQYSYDALNRLISVTDAEGGTVTYSYDAVGNRTAMTDANSHTTTYTYDALNHLVSVTDPLSHTVAYAYDAVGNRTGRTKADGTVISYDHDALDRLVDISAPGLSIGYAYDAVGNRTTMTDTVGVTSYTYDDLNRLTQVAGPNSALTYSYDLNDNRSSLTYPDSKVATYTYDLADRLTAVTDWDSRITAYTYDDANRQTAVQYPNGTQATYAYDDADRPLSIVHTSSVSGTIAVFTYTLDAVGNRLTMQDLDGTTTYAYDDLYRLTQVTYPDGETVTYAYDAMGNRTAMTSTVSGAVTYTYDAADRLLTLSDGTTFTWDANGNMIGKDSATYTFDALDRLTQVVSDTTTVQFTYDGDGVRLSKTVNGTATDYVQDVAAPLPVVLAETTAGQTSRYVYGNDLLAQVDPASNPSFYHSDGLGSTRALSNLAGQRTDAYSYDVFGAVRSHTGSAAQPFTFTGEQVDSELRLIFLRARYYDPSVGRFVSSDPFPGMALDPLSLTRYPYARCNPVVYTDPSGKAAQAIAGTICQLIDLGLDLHEVIQHTRRLLDPRPVSKGEVYEVGTDFLLNLSSELVEGVVGASTGISCVLLAAELVGDYLLHFEDPTLATGDYRNGYRGGGGSWGGPPSGGK